MPLENHLPLIDARRYDDIVKELRNRIPRYVPEWTDFNESDPGMTMVQLFAWLADMLLYRMNKIPELNEIKFLQLLGMELTPAEPARAEITFPVADSYNKPFVIVPMRTQVTAEADDGGPPIIFETERAFKALAAKLDKVQVLDRGSYSDISEAHLAPGQVYEPFGRPAVSDNALLLGFNAELPAHTELDLTAWIDTAETNSAPCDCSLPTTKSYAPINIAWEFWAGSEWRSMNVLKDETGGFTRSGHVVLKTSKQGEMKAARIGEVADERFWIKGRLVGSSLERPPRLHAIRTNTAPTVQAETARDEVLDDSDGSPSQERRLANAPVVRDSLKLEVYEEDGKYYAWELVEDFFSSKKDDRHYVLNRVTGEIRFGDGENGRIPPGLPESRGEGIIAREYRFGGGKRGNVGEGKIKTLMSSLSGIDANGVNNLKAAHSGRDEETLEEAKKRIPQSLKSRCRAVTEKDFEDLAKQAAIIKRAKALPLYHPDFPGIKVPGVVTVIVVPDSDEDAPVPSEGTLRTVCEYLNQRRLLTTELYVVRPKYQKVEIRAEVIVDDNVDLADVKEKVLTSLNGYFHPLKGGEDGMGWPFGEDIFFSKVYQRIFTVPGIRRIESVKIVKDGEEAAECKDVTICDGVLPYSGEHEVDVSYSSEL